MPLGLAKNTSKGQERGLRRVVDLFRRSPSSLDNSSVNLAFAVAPSGTLQTIDEGPVILYDGGESPEVE
jgi:hypothetical protein